MMVGGALALRTGAVIAATVALAVLLSVLLSGLKFEQKLHDVTGSRLAVVADELRRRVEFGLTLGLDLSELVDLQALVERAASGEEILGVEVVDEGGTVLFAADRAAVGQPTPIRWGEDAAPAAIAGIRQQASGGTLILAAGLRNSFGQPVGEVVLRASLGGLHGRIARVEADLAAVILLLVALTAAVTLAAVFLVVRQGGGRRGLAGGEPQGAERRRIDQGLDRADAAMAELERDLDALAARGTVP